MGEGVSPTPLLSLPDASPLEEETSASSAVFISPNNINQQVCSENIETWKSEKSTWFRLESWSKSHPLFHS